MVELYSLFPLFPGESELHQFEKLCEILGTPSRAEWPDAYRLAERRGYKMPNIQGKGVDSILSRYNACPEAIDLVIKCLRYNPKV